MKNTAIDRFYNTDAWHKCRRAFIKSKGGLCERCYQNGIVTAGEHVHHIKHITLANLSDPSITLNHDNLMLLCRTCHEKEHGKHKVKTDTNGHVEL